MLILASSASLAQLGSGLALALAIFTEPITLREQRQRRKLDGAFKLLPRARTEDVEDKETSLLVQVLNLNTSVSRAQELSTYPLIIIKLSAAINFLILIASTLVPDAEVDSYWSWVLLTLCVVPVVIGSVWLQIIARWTIKKVQV